MGAENVYWRRPLVDGRVEVFARLNGQTMRACGPVDTVAFLVTTFEAHANGQLPAAAVKAMRGKGRLERLDKASGAVCAAVADV